MESEKKQEQKKQGGCYLFAALGALIVVGIVKLFWPEFIPFKAFEFWYFQGRLIDVLILSWPILAWGAAVNIVFSLMGRNDPKLNKNAGCVLALGTGISTFAGVFEEISFRWILFYSAIVGAKVTNFLFFGWAGFGISEWLYTNILGPVANFLTLGYLEPHLFGPLGWAVGAAIVTSNAQFRDGHGYQGWFGWVNSWFLGMYFFYVMFTHGLFAAMLVHFLYDMLIFVVRYIDMSVERKLGWV